MTSSKGRDLNGVIELVLEGVERTGKSYSLDLGGQKFEGPGIGTEKRNQRARSLW